MREGGSKMELDKILELIELAMKVNLNTEHDIFVNISGHIRAIAIEIHLDGWVPDKGMDIQYKFNWDKETYYIPLTMKMGRTEDLYREIKDMLINLERGGI